VNNFSHLLPGGSLAPCDTGNDSHHGSSGFYFILGRHYKGGFYPYLCKILEINRCLRNHDCLHITGLENIPDLVHHVGTYIPVMENGNFVFLDLPDLFFINAKVCPEHSTADILGVGWHTAARVQHECADAVLDTLLTER